MTAAAYTPRAGSKTEAAIIALETEGRMSAEDLAGEIEVERKAIDAYLAIPLKHGAVRRLNVDGRTYFEIGGGTTSAGDTVAAVPAPARAKTPRELPPQKRNGFIAPAAPAIEPSGSVAVADDGSVLLLDGDRIAARLTARQAANVAALVARFRP